jgi:hypothetical protein
MGTATLDVQLAEIRRRIGRLHTYAQVDDVAQKSRICRHLDALQREEASVSAAEHRAPGEAVERLEQLRTRLAIAENSLAADVSDEWTTFAAAVEDELRSWDSYLERLQATSAAKAWKTRNSAEAAIADLRARRIAVQDALAEAQRHVNATWHERRTHVTAAREDLERADRELCAGRRGS